MKKTEEISRFCRALSVERRARIIELLRDGPLCVGALARRLKISQSAVSQHLRVLKDVSLVKPIRNGLFLHYEINEDVFAARYAQLGDLIATCSSKDKHGCSGSCKKRSEQAGI